MKITACNSEILEEGNFFEKLFYLVIGYICCPLGYVFVAIGKGFYILKKRSIS